MKTIEEAAEDYFKEYGYNESTAENLAFKAGVEFAQRWIPVEEGLPDFLTDVLLKLSNGKITIGCLFSEKLFNVEVIDENIKVTHYRPIEYK